MLVLALRRLVGLAVSIAMISFVANLGPGLAARSMGGFVQQLNAAQSGDTARAQQIADDLTAQWQGLELEVNDALHRVESTLQQLAPDR